MTSGFRRFRIFAGGTRGSAATEFALVLPLFALLTIGVFNMTFLMFAANSLHFATERAARCVSLTPTSCPVQVATPNLTSYAASQYKGPRLQSVTYSLYSSGATTTTNCGNHVRASGTFPIQERPGQLQCTDPGRRLFSRLSPCSAQTRVQMPRDLPPNANPNPRERDIELYERHGVECSQHRASALEVEHRTSQQRPGYRTNEEVWCELSKLGQARLPFSRMGAQINDAPRNRLRPAGESRRFGNTTSSSGASGDLS